MAIISVDALDGKIAVEMSFKHFMNLSMSKNNYLIEVKDLKKYYYKQRLFSSKKEMIRAVDGVSFRIKKGETLGLVGESGCGKTTVGKSILRLIEPTSGQIFFKGINLNALDRDELRRLRPSMQFIFQDPYESLNPRMRIEDIVGEGLEIHKIASGKEKSQRVSEILERVGLQSQDKNRYPHEFSGGQRQRIGIARAISLNPEFIVADEPVSALDVSIQAQILNLLMDLRDELGLTYLFISHDLRIVKHISDRVAVMYQGKIVEMADCEEIFKNPLHPYTQLLLKAIPKINGSRRIDPFVIKLENNQTNDLPWACSFFKRCPISKDRCKQAPSLIDQGNGHLVACHFNY